MKRLLLAIAGLGLLTGTATLVAADFWAEKPYLDWSDKDVEKMLENSPWASTTNVAMPPPPPRPSDDAGGRGGRGGGEGFGPDARRVLVTVSWRSALPVKQAVVRSSAGQGGTPSDEQKAFLAQAETFYVLAIAGLPPQYSMVGPNTEIEAFLDRKDKPRIALADRMMQRAATGPVVLLAFPRGEITPEDREVELAVKIDRLSFKRKFKLADMMFEGQLAL